MRGLNLSQFKKMKEDNKTVTMGHPKGHSITILKSELPAIQRKQIEKLPVHLADGGAPAGAPTAEDVANLPGLTPEQAQAIGQPPAQASDNQFYGPSSPIQQGVIPPSQVFSSGNGEIGPQDNAAPTSQAPSNQISASGSPIDLNASYAQGQNAIKEQQNVSSQHAKSNAAIEAQEIQDRQAFQASAAEHLRDLQQHKDDFVNYIQSHPIDPKHYQENMGATQKVATAIGLLLGGFSGGLNKTGVNPAADFLNKQIDRDIQGQRDRMDQQKTILGANQSFYGDQVLTDNATRINMNDIYNNKLQMAASQLGTAQAKAAADAQSSQFAMQNNGLLQQNAIRASALQQMQGGGRGLSPAVLGQAGFMSPEEATKEEAAFQKQKVGIARINDLYDQLDQEQSSGNLANPQSYTRANEIKSQIRNEVLGMDVNHRYSEETAKGLIDPNLYGTLATQKTRDLARSNVLGQAQSLGAGAMPNFARLAPAAVPKFASAAPAKPSYQPGQIVYVKGQRGQVLPDGRIQAVQ